MSAFRGKHWSEGLNQQLIALGSYTGYLHRILVLDCWGAVPSSATS